MKEVWDSIVIGGGQARLASGYHLQKKDFGFSFWRRTSKQSDRGRITMIV